MICRFPRETAWKSLRETAWGNIVSESTTGGESCFVWEQGDVSEVEIVDYH